MEAQQHLEKAVRNLVVNYLKTLGPCEIEKILQDALADTTVPAKASAMGEPTAVPAKASVVGEPTAVPTKASAVGEPTAVPAKASAVGEPTVGASCFKMGDSVRVANLAGSRISACSWMKKYTVVEVVCCCGKWEYVVEEDSSIGTFARWRILRGLKETWLHPYHKNDPASAEKERAAVRLLDANREWDRGDHVTTEMVRAAEGEWERLMRT